MRSGRRGVTTTARDRKRDPLPRDPGLDVEGVLAEGEDCSGAKVRFTGRSWGLSESCRHQALVATANRDARIRQ